MSSGAEQNISMLSYESPFIHSFHSFICLFIHSYTQTFEQGIGPIKSSHHQISILRSLNKSLGPGLAESQCFDHSSVLPSVDMRLSVFPEHASPRTGHNSASRTTAAETSEAGQVNN